jgi:hypothetical protein
MIRNCQQIIKNAMANQSERQIIAVYRVRTQSQEYASIPIITIYTRKGAFFLI